MDARANMKQLITVILTTSMLLLSACVSDTGKGSRKSSSENVAGGSGQGAGDGQGAVAGEDGTIGDGTSNLTSLSEIRYIVDPFDGAFKTKLTIPKNFTGYLYLAGLNVTKLKDRFVYVRFNFGRDLTSIEIPATIGQAEGLTPQTNIEVITLDMNNKPFEAVRLSYDLFDYKDYRDGSGSETGDVISDPRDNNLYCRGLKILHDPTYVKGAGNAPNGLCNETGDVCKYAYAKVLDSSLYVDDSALSASEPHYDIAGSGYTLEPFSNRVKKCLPDSLNRTAFNTAFSSISVADPQYLAADPTFGAILFAESGKNYVYKGPYRTTSESLWEITGQALFTEVNSSTKGTGLFQKSFAPHTAEAGYRSFLFPRAGKMDLTTGVEYYGSSNAFDEVRGIDSLNSSGSSLYMDSCSYRMQNYDSQTNEGVGSCNVSATIELWVKEADGTKTKITETTDVKLQLVRTSLTNYQGEDVMYSSLKNCSNSRACGSDECCFNKRCWSKELVNQCPEDVSDQDNRDTGTQCSSDYQCSSLCCGSSGVCTDHVNTSTQQVLCNKSPGQTCVAQEWCRKENIRECDIYKTGTDAQGAVTCGIRCFNVQKFGECLEGQCRPPVTPAVPTFDPATFDCANAKALPSG